MGLDISYYVNAKLVPDAERDDDGYPTDDSLVLAYVNSDFAEHADDIQHDAIYAYDDSGAFRAGSYGGYNEWRDALAEMAGYPALAEAPNASRSVHAAAAWGGHIGPFHPLINFSDCEGIIGPQTSARLAADFAKHQTKADAIGGYFAEQYRNWRAAFEAVAGNGFVDFH